MRDLDPASQGKLIDLLNNKMSKVSDKVAPRSKASETVCSTVKRYRHKVIIDLKRLYNQSKNDPENSANKLKIIAAELAAQKKVRAAHEKTIEEQKALIDELMKKFAGGKNPDLDRVKRGSVDSPLPPIGRGRGGGGRGTGNFRTDSRGPNVASPTKSVGGGGRGAMFQMTLGDDMEGGMGGMGGMGPSRSPNPMGGRGGRGGRGQNMGGPGMGRGGPGMGRGGPVFGGQGGGRGGARGGMGGNRGYGNNRRW